MAQKIIAHYAGEGNDIARAALDINDYPDTCPLCHKGIEPIFRYAWLDNERVAILFQCPKSRCHQVFVSMYTKNDLAYMGGPDIFDYRGSAPWKPQEHIFPGEITAISKTFCETYNESEEAERRDLKNICGAGYRRALEFLIKDYLINVNGGDPEILKEKPLGACIDEDIDDKNIRESAKRAAWLGNDQTHYYRKWEDKDLSDLKNLIGLTVNWIHNVCLTRKIMEEMPEGKGKGHK